MNLNYTAIRATLQITSYALGVCIALLFTCQLHESLIKLYSKQFSIFQLFSWIKVKVLISFASFDFTEYVFHIGIFVDYIFVRLNLASGKEFKKNFYYLRTIYVRGYL